MTITLDDKTKVYFKRYKGHAHLDIPLLRKGGSDSARINFIYDTGAYLTVISKEMYKWHELDKLPRRKAAIGSYNGSSSGYIFQIPGLVIGQRVLLGVWAFTPENEDIKQNLLGDNVIEYFRPFQDNLDDCFYFIDNPTPEPYVSPDKSFSLACDNVMFVNQYCSQ